MRIVVDTNVVISGILFGGKPQQLLEMIVRQEHQAVASQEVLAEYRRILKQFEPTHREKFNRKLEGQIFPLFEICKVEQHVDVCTDKDDNIFLDAAIAGRCLYVISGDNHLRSIGKYKDIEIITVAEFLSRYAKEES